MVVVLVSTKTFIGSPNNHISMSLLGAGHTLLVQSSSAQPRATKLLPSILNVRVEFTNGKTVSKDWYSRGLGPISGYPIGPKVQRLTTEKGLFLC